MNAAKSKSVTVIVSEKRERGELKPKYSAPCNGPVPGELADRLGDSHVNLLPRKQLIVVLLSISMGMFIAFADQTAVTVGLDEIGRELNSQSTINWAGTSSLLANTVCQVLFGRLSDIVGRKNVFIGSLGVLGIADLACGFAQTGPQFFVFRAFAGIGQGGISSLAMVIMSDVVTLKQRGKYQGILGTSVGLGNSVGPFIMAAFISDNKHWRYFYHVFAPIIIMIAVAIYFLLPGKPKSSDEVLTPVEKLKKIDYLGILTATSALTLILIPLSGGGSTYPWDSPIVISMFIVGGVLLVSFLFIEWKVPELPMIPLRLFKNPLLCLILGSNFFFGMVYYSFLFYIPYYFQIVRGKDEVISSVFLLPIVLTQAGMSTVLGNVISYTGHYIYTVLFGYTLWTLGCGLLIIWDEHTNYGACVVILLIIGIGIGSTFQPTMVAAQAQAKKADRAVVISTRNVLRSFGGAVGIAIASTMISNTFLKEINTIELDPGAYYNIPQNYLDELKENIFSKVDVSFLNDNQVSEIRHIYMVAIKNYFYLLVPFIAVCLISSFFIRDRGLQCLDETPEEQIHKEALSVRTSRTDFSTDVESNNSHEGNRWEPREVHQV